MSKCEAFELRYVDDASNSNKFYRIYVIGGSTRVVYQWGRVGAVGQWQHKTGGWSAAEAQMHAKEAKGYEMFGENVAFEIPDNILVDLIAHQDWLDRMFRSAAPASEDPNSEAAARLAAREEKEDAAFKATLLKLQAKVAKNDPPKPGEPVAAAELSMQDKLAAALEKAKASK